MNNDLKKVSILGVNISVVGVGEVIQTVAEVVESRTGALINNVNAHACNLAYTIPEFKKVLNNSEIVFCDGFGVKLAAWLKQKKVGVRMTPPDWIDDLFHLCVDKQYSVFFVGDHGEVVDLFARAVQDRHPNIRIAGQHHGYFEIGSSEDDELISELKDCDADVIITGMGMPRQELWAAQAKERVGKGVFIATGSMFRWYTRYERRAPRYITDHGFEWLARLISRPIVHFRRYVVGLPLFFIRVLTYRDQNG